MVIYIYIAIVFETLLAKKQQYASGLQCLLLKNKSESVPAVPSRNP